ncbi:hypothetical protein [Clostridium baratii]|uniref:hypothetical protein n=1 Tax=Clostridium baratii TaxID=1561 RepID=UPI0030CAF292
MRIIGYNDPRKLNELKEWDELKKYHHFCISQTLVQGLSREYGRTEFKVLTTIDRLIKKFYKEWTDNPENDLKHFLDVRRAIEKIKNNKLRKSFMENRREVYNSIRFLLECDITSTQLEKDNLTKDKIEFLNIYKEIEKNSNWLEVRELDSKTIYSLKEAIKEIIIDEIERETVDKRNGKEDEINDVIKEVGNEFHTLTEEDKSKYLTELIGTLNKKVTDLNKKRGRQYRILKERLEMYKSILTNYEEKEIKKVIFHGIHQFTPIMIKLIKYLEKNNIEVIFLINYNDEFKRLYSTWDKVYEWTNCDIEKKKTGYKYDQLEIAKNYSAIVEGNFDKLLKSNDIVVKKFDNYTEMSNYVAEIYLEAKNSLKDPFDSTKVLGRMTEQFYAVDGTNINDMLKVYFPEQFEQKHFLAYPVGQLILAIYNLWDENKNKIVIEESSIRECLATNIWSKNKERILYSPTEIFEMIKVYFSDLEGSNINNYLKRISELKKNISIINNIPNDDRKCDYKRLGFYKLGLDEIDFFESIILEIKEIIETLMGDGKERNIISHYKNLLSLISEKINASKDENIKKEIEFVKEISERLNKVDSDSNESIAAIKETLHFYLAQNKNEDSSNWIVRDFNQIDGGVLLADPNAKEKTVKDKKAIYHFMEVSDNDMQGKTKTNLSWPLDEEFIGTSTEILEIIKVCKKEYKNYLRCTLFYALFYIGEIEIKISYVENKEDSLKEELYYVLKLLNIEEEQIHVLNDMNFKEKITNSYTSEIIDKDLIKVTDVINYNFCEQRFLYESLVEGEGSFNSEFLINQYLKNLIAISLFKKGDKENLNDDIKKVIPYASDTLIDDISFAVREKVKKFKEYGNINDLYELVIKNYIFAKFTGENIEKDKKIEESLLNYRENTIFVNEILDYLNGGNYKGKKEISDKCVYCKYRQICVG